ncbi:MAG: polysaccharide deacetylase family protein [Calditrichaeota bacterium]|nr:polysaccharide deacetylase family protein [Calditrichota bacterium]
MKWFNYLQDIPVLTYHKVCDNFELGITNVNKSSFSKQMQFLNENAYQTILPSDYKSITDSNRKVILSFDDAYENIYEIAFPIMEKYGFKGLIFPIVNYIGKLNSWDANLAGIKFRHASKDQLNELLKHGWEIGSHTLTHTSFGINQDFEKEIVDSKKNLEDQFSTLIQSFSFPFGRSAKKVRQLIENNYDYAFSGQMHRLPDQYEISRSAVYKMDSLTNFKSKLNAETIESFKLAMIHKGAIATEIYQKFS